MLPADDPQVSKRAVNLSVDEGSPGKTREPGINPSTTLEQGLVETLRKKKREQWLAENQDAIKAYNEYVDKHGVFSEK